MDFNLPPEQPKKNWFASHMIVGYVFLFAVFAAAASGYYYWQTVRSLPTYEPVVHRDLKENWKTYTNDQYGFEFRYPSSLTLETTKDSARLQNYISNDDPGGLGPTEFFIEISPSSLEAFGSYHISNVKTGNLNGYKTQEGDDLTAAISPLGPHVLLVSNESMKASIFFAIYTHTPDETIKKQIVQILSTFKFIDNKNVSFKLIDLGGAYGSETYFDYKLVKIDLNGAATVLVPSIKKAVPELQTSVNRTLQELSFPAGSNRLYFVEIISDSDAPSQNLFVYDIKLNQFSKMKVSEYYAGFGVRVISPDGLKIASTGSHSNNDQKLYLISLNSDTVKNIISLNNSETFNYCVSNCFGGFEGYVSWVNDNTIEYNVYDITKITGDINNQSHTLIQTRTINVNN